MSQPYQNQWQMSAMQHSALVDEKYIAIRTNIDQNLRDKIMQSEYVDFT